MVNPGQNMLSIVSVVYEEASFWELNVALTRRMNPEGGIPLVRGRQFQDSGAR